MLNASTEYISNGVLNRNINHNQRTIMKEYSVVWESAYGLEQKNVWANSENHAVEKVTKNVDHECADCLVEVCEV